eukprot:3841120-Amphidinium_carterae.1
MACYALGKTLGSKEPRHTGIRAKLESAVVSLPILYLVLPYVRQAPKLHWQQKQKKLSKAGIEKIGHFIHPNPLSHPSRHATLLVCLGANPWENKTVPSDCFVRSPMLTSTLMYARPQTNNLYAMIVVGTSRSGDRLSLNRSSLNQSMKAAFHKNFSSSVIWMTKGTLKASCHALTSFFHNLEGCDPL